MSSEDFWNTFPMIYLITGIFYNYYQFTSFIIKKLRQENIFIYFIVLACSDVMVLFTSLLSEWLKITIKMDICAVTKGGCRLNIWLSGAVMDIPPWILVTMAYEKRALLWFPVPADSQFSRSQAKLLMMVLTALCLFRQQPILWGDLRNSIEIVIIKDINSTTDVTFSNSSSSSHSVESKSKPVCDVTGNGFGIFMVLCNPWIDLMLRVLAPCFCLLVYNAAVLRKIHREKTCASQLMEKVGIHPPVWFYSGILEMQNTVKWTGLLTILIFINYLPYSFYFILQPTAFESDKRFNSNLWLFSNLMFYLNYIILFPVLAVQDNSLIAIMRTTWQIQVVRKRGTMTASLAPRILPEGANPTTVNSVLNRTYNRLILSEGMILNSNT